jgi:anti-sigma-K factor RskA
MSGHEQFAEDLALYALNALEGEERTALEQHLEGCASCRRELEALRGDMALLALSTAGPAPPQRARQRLMAAVSREPRAAVAGSASGVPRRWGWGSLGWVAAAAMAVAAVWFWHQSDTLAQLAEGLKTSLSHQQEELGKTRLALDTLTSQKAQSITVLPVDWKGAPPPQGKAIYERDRSSLVFIASNLPALPGGKAYELWLIPVSGAPIPAGVFKPDARGSATVVNPPLPSQVEAKAFAITVEDEAGATTPTMPIRMVGAGS